MLHNSRIFQTSYRY